MTYCKSDLKKKAKKWTIKWGSDIYCEKVDFKLVVNLVWYLVIPMIIISDVFLFLVINVIDPMKKQGMINFVEETIYLEKMVISSTAHQKDGILVGILYYEYKEKRQ